jgi:hypothetical protein
VQLSGQGMGRPGLMVHGRRPKLSEEKLDVYGDPRLNTVIQRRLAAQDQAAEAVFQTIALGVPTAGTMPAPAAPAGAPNGGSGSGAIGDTITVPGVERMNPYGNWGPQAQPINDDD